VLPFQNTQKVTSQKFLFFYVIVFPIYYFLYFLFLLNVTYVTYVTLFLALLCFKKLIMGNSLARQANADVKHGNV